MKNHTREKATWKAIIKFADDESLSDQEWHDLSALSLIDRTRLMFEPGNCQWARSEKERQDNERFYRSLSPSMEMNTRKNGAASEKTGRL